MVALLIRGEVSEKEVKAVALAKDRYKPLLDKAVARPWPWIGVGVGAFVLAGLAFLMLGREFIPQLDEGDIALQGIRIPSTSLNQSLTLQRQIERTVRTLPEVAFMYSKTGTAEVGTDPMPANISDSFVILKPKSEWPDGVDSKEEVVERLEAKLKPLVGSAFEISQPIELRFQRIDCRCARRHRDQALWRRSRRNERSGRKGRSGA
jgi:cobalt-zinc-cadmium resistance protein CzcA